MSQKELAKFKQRLLKLQHDLGRRSESLLEGMQEEERPTGEHEPRIAPSAAAESDRLIEQVEERIGQQIFEALERVAEGTYGRCQQCGKPIPQVRLEAIPYATYCVECEREIEAGYLESVDGKSSW
jgi:DnaK suppressor protein